MADERHNAVAIVDDDAAFLDALRLVVELAGYSVSVYDSPMAFLADRSTSPACLIVDYHMPQMTGLELAGQLRAEGTNIPILLVTSALSPAIMARAGQLGIEKVLPNTNRPRY